MVNEKAVYISPFEQLKREYEKNYTEDSVILPFAKTEVFFRGIKSIEQKQLLRASESGKESVINKAIDEVLLNIVSNWGNIASIDDTYLKDRNYLLLVARALSKSETLKFIPTCNTCETKGLKEIEINIPEIEVKPLPEELYKREFFITTVDSEKKYKVILSPPTRKKEKQKEAYQVEKGMKLKKKGSAAEEKDLIDVMFIDSIYLIEKDKESKLDLTFNYLVELHDILLGKDKDLITKYILEVNKYGFPVTTSFYCEECEKDIEVLIDFSDFLLM